MEDYCLSALLGTFPTVCYVAEESVCGVPVNEDGISPTASSLVAPKYRNPLSGAR